MRRLAEHHAADGLRQQWVGCIELHACLDHPAEISKRIHVRAGRVLAGSKLQDRAQFHHQGEEDEEEGRFQLRPEARLHRPPGGLAHERRIHRGRAAGRGPRTAAMIGGTREIDILDHTGDIVAMLRGAGFADGYRGLTLRGS